MSQRRRRSYRVSASMTTSVTNTSRARAISCIRAQSGSGIRTERTGVCGLRGTSVDHVGQAGEVAGWGDRLASLDGCEVHVRGAGCVWTSRSRGANGVSATFDAVHKDGHDVGAGLGALVCVHVVTVLRGVIRVKHFDPTTLGRVA